MIKYKFKHMKVIIGIGLIFSSLMVLNSCEDDNEICTEGCKKGVWGLYCNETCGEACKSGFCDQHDGSCLHDCQAVRQSCNNGRCKRSENIVCETLSSTSAADSVPSETSAFLS